MNPPGSGIMTAFAVPLISLQRPEDGLNARLRELILQREDLGAQSANPRPYTYRNQAVFESDFDLFETTQVDIRALRDFCFNSLINIIRSLSSLDEKQLRSLRIGADAWFHVTRPGGMFGLHNHPMASWSGVYCVNPGTDNPGTTEDGELVFYHPQIMVNMFVDSGNASLMPPFDLGSRKFKLRPGQLILFPSWLLHEVKPFHGEGERITVAFNAWFHQQNQTTG
jgi:hypothetical protein